MLCADVLIINCKGEINSEMVNTLKVCCVTYDDLKKSGNSPEIIYTCGQNIDKDKQPFINQVYDLKTKVIEAMINESDSIKKTAEDLLDYKDYKINILGNAYKNESIQKDDLKGIK